MNRLSVNISGNGKPLLALHGWGMNSHVWSSVKPLLEKELQVSWLDLPGHGANVDMPMTGLDAVVEQIASLLVTPTAVMGWSLGGLVAQRLAQRYPEKVTAQVLVSTTPRFVVAERWENAMPADLLDKFKLQLEDDFPSTLKRFLALQFMGVQNVQSHVRQLREEILSAHPNTIALAAGLEILMQTDLRSAFRDGLVPGQRLWLLGKLDRLVPYHVKHDLAVLDPAAQVEVIADAGHAPFISHAEYFSQRVLDFLKQSAWQSA